VTGRSALASGRSAAGVTARATATAARRPPWWVLLAGFAALLGASGWVAAQPLPPSKPTPALQAVENELQQQKQSLANLQSQAQSWQAQRSTVAAQLQQEENTVAALTGQTAPATTTGGVTGSSAPTLRSPPITMTGGS